MTDILTKHAKKLEKFNQERVFWLKLSAFVCIVILLILADWNILRVSDYIWYFVIAGLTVAVLWWYWTMRIFRHILTHRVEELVILKEIVEDVKDVKNELKKINIPIDTIK